MLARGVLGLPRYPVRALRSLPSALPNLDETPFGNAPRRRDAWPRPPSGCAERSAASARAASSSAPTHKPPRTSFNGRVSPHRRFVFGRLDARRGEGGQEPPRLHRQRRRRRDLRRRRAPLADLPHRAPGRPARRPDPGLGAQRGPAGHLRQPDHADERAAVHQRRRPGRAAARDPRGARVDEGAPPGDAGRAAPGREPLHPPGRVRPRRARDLHPRLQPPRPADLEPRDLERPRAAVPALLRRRHGSRPTTRSRWSPTAWG